MNKQAPPALKSPLSMKRIQLLQGPGGGGKTMILVQALLPLIVANSAGHRPVEGRKLQTLSNTTLLKDKLMVERLACVPFTVRVISRTTKHEGLTELSHE